MVEARVAVEAIAHGGVGIVGGVPAAARRDAAVRSRVQPILHGGAVGQLVHLDVHADRVEVGGDRLRQVDVVPPGGGHVPAGLEPDAVRAARVARLVQQPLRLLGVVLVLRLDVVGPLCVGDVHAVGERGHVAVRRGIALAVVVQVVELRGVDRLLHGDAHVLVVERRPVEAKREGGGLLAGNRHLHQLGVGLSECPALLEGERTPVHARQRHAPAAERRHPRLRLRDHVVLDLVGVRELVAGMQRVGVPVVGVARVGDRRTGNEVGEHERAGADDVAPVAHVAVRADHFRGHHEVRAPVGAQDLVQGVERRGVRLDHEGPPVGGFDRLVRDLSRLPPRRAAALLAELFQTPVALEGEQDVVGVELAAGHLALVLPVDAAADAERVGLEIGRHLPALGQLSGRFGKADIARRLAAGAGPERPVQIAEPLEHRLLPVEHFRHAVAEPGVEVGRRFGNGDRDGAAVLRLLDHLAEHVRHHFPFGGGRFRFGGRRGPQAGGGQGERQHDPGNPHRCLHRYT